LSRSWRWRYLIFAFAVIKKQRLIIFTSLEPFDGGRVLLDFSIL
jgi:hypothetical protein